MYGSDASVLGSARRRLRAASLADVPTVGRSMPELIRQRKAAALWRLRDGLAA